MRLHNSWDNVLQNEFDSPYFKQIVQTVLRAYAETTVYPPKGSVFNAFKLTELDKVKCVILGQDPYYGAGQAMGLSFSVPSGVQLPPSLKNIYKEISDDIGIDMSHKDGSLRGWAEQGVFLLNAILTVRAGAAASHSRLGWQTFTDAVIQTISDRRDGIVFLLWGNFARSKKALIDTSRHYVLEAAHPSPLAGGAFFGCRHFSKTNEILINNGSQPIDWSR